MNRNQREKNRITAYRLGRSNRECVLMQHTCENCGEPGGHWLAFPQTLEDILLGRPQQGIYSCKPKATDKGTFK